MLFWVFSLLVMVFLPFAFLFAELLSGWNTIGQGFMIWISDFDVLFGMVISAIIVSIIWKMGLRKYKKTGEALVLKIIRLIFILWGGGHGTFLGYIHYSDDYFHSIELANVLTGMYGGAVGIFWSVLAILSSANDDEKIAKNIEKNPVFPLKTSLFMGVNVAILAFLVGAIGVSLMPIANGLTVEKALPRILLVAIPFLLISLLLVQFLHGIIVKPIEKSVLLVGKITQGDWRPRFDSDQKTEIGTLLKAVNILINKTSGLLITWVRQGNRNSTHLIRLLEYARSLNEQSENLEETSIKNIKLISEVREQVTNFKQAFKETLEVNNGIRKLRIQQNSLVQEISAAAEEIASSSKQVSVVSVSRMNTVQNVLKIVKIVEEEVFKSQSEMKTINSRLNDLQTWNKLVADIAQ